MTRIWKTGNRILRHTVAVSLGLAAVFAVLGAPCLHGDEVDDARNQFQRAEKMRTSLEGLLEKDRSLDNYKKTVIAYRKVYLITPDTVDAAPALAAEGELYEQMGKLFGPEFFQTAIERFNFLLKQYPGSKYRFEALFSIGKIQEEDLKTQEDAAATFKQFLKQFPHADRAKEAQRELKAMAAAKSQPDRPTEAAAAPDTAKPADARTVAAAKETSAVPALTTGKSPAISAKAMPELTGQAVEPRVSDRRISSVMAVRTWDSENSTRIIVTLNDTIKYDAVRIPDRIYFDLYKAQLGPKLEGKRLDLPSGVVKSIHVAQNQPDVVRVVMEVSSVKTYSAFLLGNPYRLVIDVHDRGANAAPLLATSAMPNGTNGQTEAGASGADKSSAATRGTAAGKNDGANNEQEKSLAGIEIQPKPAVVVTPKGSKSRDAKALALQPPTESKPMRDGQRSLSRVLGLKVSRIVIDPGHGGYDTGTVGPHGLMEKDLCLDVAQRLGALIEKKLPGAQVIYTRTDDTFVPLEERTAIANRAKADLFISIHANSSHDDGARGVETYYLSFANSPESMQVASRENATAQESVHDLQDLVKKIAENEKVEESRELATDVQDSLTQRLQLVSRGERDRGVKRAPFVVLIGANMPSILSEISFVSNPSDERLLRKPEQRERIATGIYRGIASYLDSTNSLAFDKQKTASAETEDGTAVASNGNPK